MPGGLALGLELVNANESGSSGGTTFGTTVTASGSTNTKGPYTTLNASTASDACYVLVTAIPGGANTLLAFDLAVGPAASEQVVASNVVVALLNNDIFQTYFFPISIPAGTRISARCQSSVASATVLMTVTTFDGAFTQMEGCAGVDAIGFVSASTHGTAVGIPGSGTAKGSYAQLVASTTRDYIGFFMAIDTAGLSITASVVILAIDIAIGGAGSEKVILPNVMGTIGTVPNLTDLPLRDFIPIPILAGSRVAARTSVPGSAGTIPASFGLTLYGVYL